jgi:hypothetical protein
MGKMDEGEKGSVVAERLPDLGAWELYLFSLEDSGDTVCKVALQAGAPDGIEYGVFYGEDGEPSASGTVAQPRSWSDETREDALKEILTIYSAKLLALSSGVVFDFYGERKPEEHERDEDEDEDEDYA